MSIFFIQNQRTGLVPVVGGGSGEKSRRVNVIKYSIDMYVNRKMVSVETIPGMGGGGEKEMVEGVN
jgi:hypothetical protein